MSHIILALSLLFHPHHDIPMEVCGMLYFDEQLIYIDGDVESVTIYPQ